MKVFLTGGSSLLGRTVAEQLAARGDQVTCFQRSPSGTGTTDAGGRGTLSDSSATGPERYYRTKYVSGP